MTVTNPAVAAGYQQAPPPVRPLDPRHRTAALGAGALGGGLVGLGVSLLAGVVFTIGLTGLLSFTSPYQSTDPDTGVGAEFYVELSEHAWAALASPLGIGLLVAGGVLGVVAIVLGIVLGIRMLRRSGVRRPAGVAWSALGIVRGADVLLGNPSLMGSAAFAPIPMISAMADVSSATGGDPMPEQAVGVMVGIFLVVGIVGVLISAVVQAGISMLAWWWMALAFRSRTWPTPDETTATSATASDTSAEGGGAASP